MLALALAACASQPDSSSGTSAGTPESRGHAAASRLCSSCHAVGRFDQSAHSEAPPFRTLSDIYAIETLAASLVEGLMTGHPDMPEFRFTTEGANDFIAYLESIQQPGVRPIKPGS